MLCSNNTCVHHDGVGCPLPDCRYVNKHNGLTLPIKGKTDVDGVVIKGSLEDVYIKDINDGGDGTSVLGKEGVLTLYCPKDNVLVFGLLSELGTRW